MRTKCIEKQRPRTFYSGNVRHAGDGEVEGRISVGDDPAAKDKMSPCNLFAVVAKHAPALRKKVRIVRPSAPGSVRTLFRVGSM